MQRGFLYTTCFPVISMSFLEFFFLNMYSYVWAFIESSTEIKNRNTSPIVIQVDTLMASIKVFPLKVITTPFVCGLGHVRDPQ